MKKEQTHEREDEPSQQHKFDADQLSPQDINSQKQNLDEFGQPPKNTKPSEFDNPKNHVPEQEHLNNSDGEGKMGFPKDKKTVK